MWHAKFKTSELVKMIHSLFLCVLHPKPINLQCAFNFNKILLE